ncbi:hypothetical protein ABTW51_09205 [Serratia nematodiphila]
MTLTTEKLNEIYENPEQCSYSEIQEMAAMLANREAQPVAWRHDDGPFAGIAITRAKSVADSWIAKGWTVTPLYTAPPAQKNRDDLKNCVLVNVEPTGDGNYRMIPPDGFKLVPIEPTENMIIDGFESDAFMALADAVNEKNGWPYGCKESAECVEGIFKAMLSAAPEKN